MRARERVICFTSFSPRALTQDPGRGRRRKSHSHVWRVSECVHELTTAPRSPQVCLIDSHVRFIHLMTHAIQPTHHPRSMAPYKQEKTRRNLNLIWIKILNLIWIKIPHAERHEKVRINVRSPPLRARALPGNKEAAGWRRAAFSPGEQRRTRTHKRERPHESRSCSSPTREQMVTRARLVACQPSLTPLLFRLATTGR